VTIEQEALIAEQRATIARLKSEMETLKLVSNAKGIAMLAAHEAHRPAPVSAATCGDGCLGCGYCRRPTTTPPERTAPASADATDPAINGALEYAIAVITGLVPVQGTVKQVMAVQRHLDALKAHAERLSIPKAAESGAPLSDLVHRGPPPQTAFIPKAAQDVRAQGEFDHEEINELIQLVLTLKEGLPNMEKFYDIGPIAPIYTRVVEVLRVILQRQPSEPKAVAAVYAARKAARGES
jgi:hypothetical protein